MKNKKIVFTAVFLIIALGTYITIISDGKGRTVEFLSIFAIGAISGVLISQIANTIKEKNKIP